MSEKFIIEGWKLFKGELFSSKQTTLQRLIDEKPYPSALAALQQSKKDHGYTDEWYREHLWELNRQWLSKVQSAVIENNRCIAELNQKIVKVNDTRFRYNYTEKELADLQFMQTLIKTRILNEGKKDLNSLYASSQGTVVPGMLGVLWYHIQPDRNAVFQSSLLLFPENRKYPAVPDADEALFSIHNSSRLQDKQIIHISPFAHLAHATHKISRKANSGGSLIAACPFL